MKLGKQRMRLALGSSSRVLAKSLIAVGLLAGCGGQAEDGFGVETYDEYSQPLTNSIIGTPDGVVVRTGPDGSVVVGGAGPVAGSIGSAGSGAFGGNDVIISAGGSGGSGGGGGRGGTGGFDDDDVIIIDPGGSGGSGGSGASGAAGRGGSGPGGAGGGTPVDPSGFGSWHLDDCDPSSHFLLDSSGFGAHARHDLGAYCVPGISDRGVQIRSRKDLIQVPDQPQFTLESRVAVAAWVKPNTVRGNQPIVIKRLNDQTSFSLGIHNGNIEMSVVLSDGTTVISRAPIEAGTFTHVAGMFDGTFVFLFINGQQFGQIYAAGTLRNVFAPIRIGATTQSQYFDGIIDEVFLSTQAISKEELAALSCIEQPTTFTVSPATSGPVPPGTSVAYDVAVSNNDVGACGNTFYSIFFDQIPPGFNASFDNSFQEAAPDTTVQFGALVTSSEDADPGVHELPFQFFGSGNTSFEQLAGEVVYEMTPPTGCFVSSRRELMITSLSVVDDPVRTAGNGAGDAAGGGGGNGSADAGVGFPVPAPAAGTGAVVGGVWSFGHLMRELAPTAEDAPSMVEQVLRTFTTQQVVNGFSMDARPGMQSTILDAWPRSDGGALDLDRAPVTLQAIVNRVDVRDLALGSAGQGRFVFGVNGSGGFPLQFTMIFEFNLPGTTEQDVLDWANLWHGLQSHPFPSEEYNAALEAVTRRFTSRNASPGSVNGSALASFRTNEIDLGFNGRWELRQFALSAETGRLRPVPLSDTPDLSFNGTPTFADFVNQNAAAIIGLVPGGISDTVPAQFAGRNFQAGAVFNDLIQWSAPGIEDPEARFHASMNTCNGCHGPETGSGFLQISPRFPGSGEAILAPFITGTIVFDPFSGEQRTLNDLARRRADLTGLVCPPGTEVSTPLPPSPPGPPVSVPPTEPQPAPTPGVGVGPRPGPPVAVPR